MRRALSLALLLVVAVLVLSAPPLCAQERAQEHEAAAAAAHEGEAAHAEGEAAHAEGGEAHGEEAAHSNTWLGLPRPLFLAFNLLVFIGGLAWFAGPVLTRFLDEKRQEIRHSLAEAERQQAEVAAMAGRLAAQIADLRREVEDLAARAEREGERERQEILADAERERLRLEASVHVEIEQGLQRARQELTAHAARLAAQLAERRIAAGLTREDRKRLFRDNLARLEAAGERRQA